MRVFASVLMVVLAACAHEWRTTEPVTPSTYQVASARSSTSVGRLARLAVLTPLVHVAAPGQANPDLPRELQEEVRSYLVNEKGYEARAVEEAAGAVDEAGIQALGQRLGVDGIVLVERWVNPPWSPAAGVSNLFLLNVPLFAHMRAPYFRASIHETASGRVVWRAELSGENPEHPKTSVALVDAFGNLENALPRQLRR